MQKGKKQTGHVRMACMNCSIQYYIQHEVMILHSTWGCIRLLPRFTHFGLCCFFMGLRWRMRNNPNIPSFKSSNWILWGEIASGRFPKRLPSDRIINKLQTSSDWHPRIWTAILYQSLPGSKSARQSSAFLTNFHQLTSIWHDVCNLVGFFC